MPDAFHSGMTGSSYSPRQKQSGKTLTYSMALLTFTFSRFQTLLQSFDHVYNFVN